VLIIKSQNVNIDRRSQVEYDMNTVFLRNGLMMATIGSACLASAYQLKVGDKSPDFSAVSMSGRRLYLKDLQEQGPVFLYFVRDGESPCSQETPYIERMLKSYGATRSNWYGVLNSKDDQVRAFMAEYSPSFRVLKDEDMSMVHALGIRNAPTVVQIGAHGKVLHVWRGFSGTNLNEMNLAMAKANHQKASQLDFSQAPSTTIYGVDFQPMIVK